jgi:hypothetical protein
MASRVPCVKLIVQQNSIIHYDISACAVKVLALGKEKSKKRRCPELASNSEANTVADKDKTTID